MLSAVAVNGNVSCVVHAWYVCVCLYVVRQCFMTVYVLLWAMCCMMCLHMCCFCVLDVCMWLTDFVRGFVAVLPPNMYGSIRTMCLGMVLFCVCTRFYLCCDAFTNANV